MEGSLGFLLCVSHWNQFYLRALLLGQLPFQYYSLCSLPLSNNSLPSALHLFLFSPFPTALLPYNPASSWFSTPALFPCISSAQLSMYHLCCSLLSPPLLFCLVHIIWTDTMALCWLFPPNPSSDQTPVLTSLLSIMATDAQPHLTAPAPAARAAAHSDILVFLKQLFQWCLVILSFNCLQLFLRADFADW